MDAVIWYEKAVPWVPFAEVALVITGDGAAMVRVSVAVPVPVELVALSVTVDVPDAVGVPETRPVEVFTDKPEGRLVALKLVGEFDAVIW